MFAISLIIFLILLDLPTFITFITNVPLTNNVSNQIASPIAFLAIMVRSSWVHLPREHFE